MMMTRFVKSILAAAALLLVVGISEARADGPTLIIEKGLPGSGVKRVEHTFTNNGLRPPFNKSWESSRKTFYEDARIVLEILNRDGTVSTRRTDITKNNHWIVEKYRPVLHSKLWTRESNLAPGQITTDVFNIDGSLKLIRVIKQAGDMYVTFTDIKGTSYSQHWLSGIAGYTLESVTATPKGSLASNKYWVLGNVAGKVEMFGADGSLKQVRHLKTDGTISVIEVWNNGTMVSTSRPLVKLKEHTPRWTFVEIGGTDDPSVPK
jgi:hypothetical protein